MTKKDYIAIADAIKEHNRISALAKFNDDHLGTLAAVFKKDNSRFLRGRWIGYVNGECGPNGGAVKEKPHGK